MSNHRPEPTRSRARSIGRFVRWDHMVPYVAAFALSVLCWAFLSIAEAMQETRVVSVEHAFMLSLRKPGAPHEPIGPHWLVGSWRDITALGSVTIVTLTTLAVVGYLILVRLWRSAFIVVLAAVGAGVLSTVLKRIFQRPRPDEMLRLVEATGASFPSGHTLVAAVMYPTLGALVAGLVTSTRAKIYILCLALLTTGLVGFSRVFLGVHYPSDVAGGLSVGFGWAIVCVVVQRALQRKRTLQDPWLEPDRGPRSR